MANRLNFSLTQLEYVQAVARHGHFGRAAQSCSVTQPTLSMQIQKLEEHLGVTIFDRSKKPILLTAVGQQLLAQIQTLLSEAKKMEVIIEKDQSNVLSGTLVVGVIPTIAPYILPRLLPLMEKNFPEVELHLKELQTERIVDALNNDDIDVGLLAIPLKIPKIFEHSLYFEPFSVLCQKNHELASAKKVKYANLKQKDIWLMEEGHCLRHQVIDVCSIKNKSTGAMKDRADDERRFKFESGSLETLKNLVDSYGGYTLLPALATDHLGRNTRLVPFERPIPSREIGLAYRREHYKLQLIEALAETILNAIPEDLRRLRQKDLDVVPI